MNETEARAIRDAIAKHIVLFRRSEFRLILSDDNSTVRLTDGKISAEYEIDQIIKEIIDEHDNAAKRMAIYMVAQWAEKKFIVD